MISTDTPLRDIVNIVHKDPTSVDSEILRSQIEHIIEFIIINTKHNGVESTSIEVLDDLFKLRLELIRSSELLRDFLSKIDQSVEEWILEQYNRRPSYPDLEQAYVSTLAIYKEIMSSAHEESPTDENISIESIPSYSDFNLILKSFPSGEQHMLLEYIKASLILDYCLITSDLVLSGELELIDSERKKLIELLKNNIELFGAYLNIYNRWTPSENNETQWERNIKIVSSHIRSQFHSETTLYAPNLPTLEAMLQE